MFTAPVCTMVVSAPPSIITREVVSQPSLGNAISCTQDITAPGENTAVKLPTSLLSRSAHREMTGINIFMYTTWRPVHARLGFAQKDPAL